MVNNLESDEEESYDPRWENIEAIREKQYEKDWIDVEWEKQQEERYRKLEKEKQQEERHFEKLEKTKTSKKDARKLEKEAKKIQHITAVDQWVRVFSRVSFCNETAIQCLFHVFFGQMLREERIELQGDVYLDWRAHMSLIQDTGTGKGKMTTQFFNVVQGMKRPAGDYCKLESVGRLTVQGLINTAVLKKDGMPKLDDDGRMFVKKGLLQDTHFVIAEEARQLLKPGKENEEIQEILMAAAEPYLSQANVYNKRLMNYLHAVETRSPTSWIATTRPLGKVRDIIAISGLLQRTLFVPRAVSDSVRKEMSKKAAFAVASKKNEKSFREDMDDMLAECNAACLFAYRCDVKIHDEDREEVAAFLWEKQEWFINNIIDTISDSDTKELLFGFTSRYRDHLLVLSHHSAAMRRSVRVEKKDIEYAFKLLQKIFAMQKLWMETRVEKDEAISKENKMIADYVMDYVASHDGCKFKDVAHYVSKRIGKTYQATSYHVKKFAQGQHKLIKIKNKKVYLA